MESDGPRLHMPRPVRAGELHDAHRLLNDSGGSSSRLLDSSTRRRKMSQVSRTSHRSRTGGDGGGEDRTSAPPPYSADESRQLLANGRGWGKSSPSKRSEASRLSMSGISLTAGNLRLHETARQSSSQVYRGTHLGVDPAPTGTGRRKGPRSRGAASATSSVLSAATLPQTPSFAAAAAALEKERASRTTAAATATATTAEHSSLIKRFLRHAERTGRGRGSTTVVIVAVVVLVKWTVGMGGYSGYGTGPTYGDLEAQRHWMGLTIHRPISEWYFYDSEYWGLDYPPLTAYHSLVMGYIGRWLNPSFVSLRPPSVTTSATGWADLHSDLKLFLRSTVVVSELLSWVPAAFLYSTLVLGRPGSDGEGKRRSWRTQMAGFATILLQPALILIDNGHFQYNAVMLGLSLGAVVCFHLGRDLVGAAMFVCSMVFKQMAIYYAPAVFAYLLGKCLFLPSSEGLTLFFNLAIVSTSTLVLLFLPVVLPSLPFASSSSSAPPLADSIFQPIHRIFPLGRGLFEDKVANFWCAANVFVKLRSLFPITFLARLSLLVTFLAVLPSIVTVVWTSRTLGHRRRRRKEGAAEDEEAEEGGRGVPPTARLLPFAMFISSMSFFLFSFQVHEKSILLPLMPLSLIMMGKEPGRRGQGEGGGDWEWGCFLGNLAVFSLWPLLKRDGLAVQYFALAFLYNYSIGHPLLFRRRRRRADLVTLVGSTSYAAIYVLHLLEATVAPPRHLPDLYVVLNVGLCATGFAIGWAWAMKRLVEESWALGFVG